MKNMTQGNPLKLIISFAIPLFFSGLFYHLYNFCDTIMVGKMVSIEALAAIGATMPIYFLAIIVGSFFSSGITIITAQNFGKKDYFQMRRSVASATTLTFVVGFLYYIVFLIGLKPLLKLSQVPADVFDLTYSYLQIMCAGGIISLFFNLLLSFLRAIGNSRGPLYFLIISSVLNIIFNYIFIKYLKLGIDGSAYGTVVAILLTAIIAVIYIYKNYGLLIPQKGEWTFSKKLAKQHLNLALPVAYQGIFISVSLFVFQMGANKLGPEAMAAIAAANRLENIATVAMYSLGMALATYVAQNYGRGRIARIRKGVFQTSIATVFIAAFTGSLMYIFSDPLLSLFSTKEDLLRMPNVMPMAKRYLHIGIIFYTFLGHIFVYRNALQSVGNSTMPLYSSIAELLVRIVAIFYFAKVFGFTAIAYTQPLAWIGGAVILYLGYYLEIKKIRDRVKNKLINQSIS